MSTFYYEEVFLSRTAAIRYLDDIKDPYKAQKSHVRSPSPAHVHIYLSEGISVIIVKLQCSWSLCYRAEEQNLKKNVDLILQ